MKNTARLAQNSTIRMFSRTTQNDDLARHYDVNERGEIQGFTIMRVDGAKITYNGYTKEMVVEENEANRKKRNDEQYQAYVNGIFDPRD
jgi:hypothetical protein